VRHKLRLRRTRPKCLLADNTPGYQQGIDYMYSLWGGRTLTRAGTAMASAQHPRGPAPFPATVPSTNKVATPIPALLLPPHEQNGLRPSAMAIPPLKTKSVHVAQHSTIRTTWTSNKSGLTALKDVGNEVGRPALHGTAGLWHRHHQKALSGWQ